MLSGFEVWEIAIGTTMGLLARLLALRVDIRQVPSYPSAFFSTIVLGFIASALGSVAIPALLTKDYTAITFLSLAIQQFREVRKLEIESYTQLEDTEYVRRGKAYIDGIAKTFESRNYFCVITSIVTVLSMHLFNFMPFIANVACSAAVGLIAFSICHRFSKGKNVGDICTVNEGSIEVRGSELYVDGFFVTSYLGTEKSRNLLRQDGIAVVLTPKAPENRITLENPGQQQAILFEAVRSLGLRRYQFMRRNLRTGQIVIAFVPIMHDLDMLIRSIHSTPILESSRKLRRIMTMSARG